MDKKSANKEPKKQNMFNKIIESMIKFFNKELKTKTKVLLVIAVIMYISFMIFFMNVASEIEDIQQLSMSAETFIGLLKQKTILLFLVLLAGLVPYFYIPVIAYVGYVATISSDVATYGIKMGNLTAIATTLIPVALDIVAISFITAIGIYMCKMFTKKFKYSQRSSFGFSDVRLQIYEIRKDKEKAEKLRKQKELKLEKMEKNNVKINYGQVFYYIILAIIVEIVVAFIETIIL